MKRSRRVLAAMTTAGLMITVASCSGSGSTQPAVSPPEAGTTAGHGTTSTPTSTTSPATSSTGGDDSHGDVIYAGRDTPQFAEADVTPSLSWRGGMVGSASMDSGRATVLGWTPGMKSVAVCTPDLWKKDEKPATDTVVKPGIDVMGTMTPGAGSVAVLYAATRTASGLDPERTTVYLQTLNLADCSLGKRVIVVEKVAKGIVASAPKFVGAGKNTLAVAPYAQLTSELPDSAALAGVTPADGKITWRKSFAGKRITIREDYRDAAQANPYVFDLGVKQSSGTGRGESRALLSAESGETVATAEDFEGPSVALAADRFVYTVAGTSHQNAQSVHDADKNTTVKGGRLKPEDSFAADDGRGNAVLVGLRCRGEKCSGDTGPSLAYLGTDSAFHDILSAEKVDALDLEAVGVSNGVVYIRTTDEHLRIGLDGKQRGTAYDEKKYPYAPVGELRVDGTLWTLWSTGHGAAGTKTDYAITRDGKAPVAEKPTQ